MSLLGVSFFYEGMKEYNTLTQEERVAKAKAAKAEKERAAELELFKKKEDYKQEVKDTAAEDARTRDRLKNATIFGQRSSRAFDLRNFYEGQGYKAGTDFMIRVDQDSNEIVETWAKDRKISDEEIDTYISNYNKAGGEGEKVGQRAVKDVDGTIRFDTLTTPKTKQFSNQTERDEWITQFNGPEGAGKKTGQLAIAAPNDKGEPSYILQKLEKDNFGLGFDKAGNPFGVNYLHYRHLGEDGKDSTKHGRIIGITPNLNVSSPDAEQSKEGVNYLYFRQPIGSNAVERANYDLQQLNAKITPEILQRILAARETNPAGFNQLRDTISGMINNWEAANTNKQSGELVTAPITVQYPWLEEKFGRSAPELMGLFDQESEAVQIARAEAGIPLNEPAMIDGEGNVRIPVRPNLANSPLVTMVGDRRVYNETFVNGMGGILRDSGVPQTVAYDILDNAYVRGENGFVQGGAAPAQAFANLQRGKSVMSGLRFTGMVGDRATFNMPPLGDTTRENIRNSVSNFSTHNDKIVGIGLMLNKRDVDAVYANTYGAGTREEVYTKVAGGTATTYNATKSRYDFATQIVQTGERVVQLLDENAKPGILGEISQFKAGAAYMMENFLPTLQGQDANSQGAIDRLRADYDSALSMPAGQDQRDALLKLNLRILSYKKASLLDPTGRLSDADRQAADEALGFGRLFVSPDIVKANVLEVMQIGTYTRDVTQNLLSGNPSLVLAASTYEYINPKVFNVSTAVVGLGTTPASRPALAPAETQQGGGIGADLRSRRGGNAPAQENQQGTGSTIQL